MRDLKLIKKGLMTALVFAAFTAATGSYVYGAQAGTGTETTIPVLTMPTAAPTPAPAASTPAPTVATTAPATAEVTPIPAAQAVKTLTIEEIISLVGTPRLNTSPVVSVAPAFTAGITPATPVTVDLIIFSGQSNMSGNGGNAALAPAVPAGAGYEYRPTSSPNALYPIVEPFGRNERGYISDQPQFQNGTLVSAFVNTYFQKTGVPVVAVPATCGGTASSFWASPAAKADLLSRYNKAKAYLEKNNFKVRKKFLVFLQGESDAVKGISAFEYKNNLTSAFQPLLAGGLDQVFIITPGYAADGRYSYDDVVNAQVDLCNSNNMFTLASNLLHSQSMNGYLDDVVHYNQQGLNLVGTNAAARVAAFAAGGM